MATRDWYYGYMDRHPKLALKAPEGMSIARAIAFNRTNVDVFFNAYAEAVALDNFTPDRIYNLDESGLSTVMKPMKVVCQRGAPVASQVARERGCHMTFVGFINAAGQTIPPVFIVARKKMNPDFKRGTVDGTTILLQSNGWMSHELFLETLKHLRERSYCSKDNKILLIMDNAECHMSIHAVEYAQEHGIVIVTLPPHTTARLQPLDVSVFGPFKTFLRGIQDDFKLQKPHEPITEHVLPEMACKAWLKAATPDNIMSGFTATGIWPINRNIFPDDAFMGAEVSERSPTHGDAELPDLPSRVTPSPSGEGEASPSPDYQPQPGPSGIVERAQPLATDEPVSPEAVQPFPKALRDCAAKGSKTRKRKSKIVSCILTTNEDAIRQLREKEQKKLEKIEKKKLQEQKKREREEKKRTKAEKGPSKKKQKVVEEDTSDEEDDLGAAPLPTSLVDDSSEYSSEENFIDEEYPSVNTYPFKVKEPEVRDYCIISFCIAYVKPHSKLNFLPNVKCHLKKVVSFISNSSQLRLSVFI